MKVKKIEYKFITLQECYIFDKIVKEYKITYDHTLNLTDDMTFLQKRITLRYLFKFFKKDIKRIRKAIKKNKKNSITTRIEKAF